MSYNFKSSETPRIYSVVELNRQVKSALERAYNGIWVEAEITEVTFARSGHVYFSLCDPGGKAQIDAVMWRGVAVRFGSKIKKGTLVRCQGRVTLYEMGGRYQFVAERIDDAGAGAKARALKELKERLTKEGLFSLDRKRSLPPVPSCVGVVTSRHGAALQDIIKVMSRRFPIRLVVAHAAVQGENASKEIVDGIRRLAAFGELDVLIVGRGGGSSEDLDAFNDEQVVRAVANCPVPVISAVGHEVDVSLCDLAADKRAATPSEAAELSVPDLDQLRNRVDDLSFRLNRAINNQVTLFHEQQAKWNSRLNARDPRIRLRAGMEALARYREALAKWPVSTLGKVRYELDSYSEQLYRWPKLTIVNGTNRLVHATQALHHWPKPRLQQAKGDLSTNGEGLYRWPGPALRDKQAQLAKTVATLDALSPLASLGRGYAIVKNESGGIIKSASDTAVGNSIDITLGKGEIEATVTKVTTNVNEE